MEYKGYVIVQDRESCHTMLFRDGYMVMHIPSTEQKTEEELRETVEFYEKLIGQLYAGELRPVESAEELSSCLFRENYISGR